MYEAFYELERRPFSTVPDPSFLFWSEGHALAYTMLRYGLMMRAPITVVTGEIGAGKTTLLRRLLGEMPEDLEVALISNMHGGRGELLHWIMNALSLNYDREDFVETFEHFQRYLIDAYARGKRVLLIFDEAQNLSVEQLEELRMLSNINSDSDEILQLMLIGQPQLRERLALPELEQFSQRIASDFHLEALSADQVEDYIQHRLALAGAKWRIFPADACRLIHLATGGVPRKVNILCDLCLVYGFSAEQKVVDEGLLREFLSSSQRRGVFRQFEQLGETPKLVRGMR